jgi:hypothetical protein
LFFVSGRVGTAGLVAPEAEVLSGPKSVELVNLLIGYLKYGLSDCFGSFGFASPEACKVGETSEADGESTYRSTSNTGNEVVEELATLLTSGRLSQKNRQMIAAVYDDTIAQGKSQKEALINAQQLIVTSPEFHSTNLGQTTGQPRSETNPIGGSSTSYKAVVFVMLAGGYDSHNILMPKVCSGTNSDGTTLDEQYTKQRGHLASKTGLSIDASNQPCSTFAVHDNLEVFKELYDSGDLAFLANVGVINQQGVSPGQCFDSIQYAYIQSSSQVFFSLLSFSDDQNKLP